MNDPSERPSWAVGGLGARRNSQGLVAVRLRIKDEATQEACHESRKHFCVKRPERRVCVVRVFATELDAAD